MLKEVIRPDQSAIRFKYDAFGRRTEKVVTGKKREKVIRFLWNGNMPFHEWEEMREADRKQPKVKVEYQADFMQRLAEREAEKARQKAGQKQPENLITWVFQDDFIPRGKLTRTGNYSIISDYLGTPVEAYDGEGIKVWERELDIYGRVKKAVIEVQLQRPENSVLSHSVFRGSMRIRKSVCIIIVSATMIQVLVSIRNRIR